MVTEKSVYQNNENTSLKNKEVKPIQPFQMNIYQVSTYRKDLSWLHFDKEPRVQERHSKLRINSPAYLLLQHLQQFQLATRRTSQDMTEMQSNLRRKRLYRLNQGSNFLGGSFSNRDNVRASIQFRTERQPQHDFSSRTDPSIFTLVAPMLLEQSNETS